MATAKKKVTKKAENELAQALKFVMLAQKPKGDAYQQHVIINNGYMIGSDGVLTAGHPIGDNVRAIAHSGQLLAALRQCGPNFTIALDGPRLAVQSGRFRGRVACLGWGDISSPIVAQNVAEIGQPLIDAISAVSCLVSDTAQSVVEATILVGPNTATATNKKAMLQYWHGYHLPEGMLIPKAMATALGKIKKTPIGFGYNEAAMSIYFEDNSFIQTQLYKDKWPPIDRILNGAVCPQGLPDDFMGACKAIAEFVDDNTNAATIKDGYIMSNRDDAKASSYKLDYDPAHIPDNTHLNVADVLLSCGQMKTADFASSRDKMYFFGDNCRAVLTKFRG